MKNVFKQADVAEIMTRLDKLTANSQPLWGKMAVAQMLAHCNVTYEMAYDNKHEKPNAFVKLLLKLFVKKQVVGDTPYKQNGQTAPAFVIKDSKDFATEKQRLVAYINKTLQLGESHFEGRESISFGVLSIAEWNTMFYKHLDHHFRQFGV